MKLKEFYNRITEKAKQHKIVLLISLVYSFIWAVCKIIFGAFTYSYFFCISGASTLIGLAQEIVVASHHIVVPSSNHPDDFVPILMTHRSAVVGNAPERVFGSVGADEAEGVERIYGAVASPFAAISTSSQN